MPPSKDALSLNIAGNKVGASDAVSAEPQALPAEPQEAAEAQSPPAEEYVAPLPQMPAPDGYAKSNATYSQRSTVASSQRRSRSAADLHSARSDVSGASLATVVKEEAAYREAMDRHIGEMEQRAAMAVFEKEEWQGHIKSCLMQEKDDIQRRKDICGENQDFVKKQMDWNQQKRKDGRKTFIENASAHDFPVFTEPPDNELQEQMRNQQQRLRSDLDAQVRTNNTLRNLARQRERELEHNQLEANRQEMAMLRSLDRSKKDHQKEVLSMAWNRDIRMRNIWKAIDGHATSGNKAAGLDMSQLGASVPPATPSLASQRSGSLPSLGRAMTGSQRRVPMTASTTLSQQRQKLLQ
jgi:hypothetical protein